MQKLNENDFEVLTECPWCNRDAQESALILYCDEMGCDIVKCKCGLVYARRRINDNGREKFWKDYMSRDHEANKKKVDQRHIMYNIESEFISKFVKSGRVLDVGCGSGDFMKIFEDKGFSVSGIEFGREAYEEAVKLGRNVILGELPKEKFDEKFDLIIFRGVIQYFPNPKEYFEKAFEILNTGGSIYLYYVNTNSICFDLFKERFSVPINGSDYLGFNTELLDDYFNENGFVKTAERDFYIGTPYEDYENDIIRVADAIKKRRKNVPDYSKSPAFFGNMMGSLYTRK